MNLSPHYNPPLKPWLDIVYHDDAVIAVNKQAGLLSVPGKISRDCIETRVQEEFSDAYIVHRLDMATSGIMVLPRGKKNLAHIGKQFEKRTTKKRYIALVDGVVEKETGTINLPIRCDWPNRPLQMICYEHGREAITNYEILERSETSTRLALTPLTGRSHQLRLHMKSIGHPIIGDEWYAPAKVKEAAPRLLLHAQELCLYHPATAEWIELRAKCPF